MSKEQIKENEKEMIQEEIIEEIDENEENQKFLTSKLYDIIQKEIILEKEGEKITLDYEAFGKKNGIPKIICENTTIENKILYNDIFYRNQCILDKPKIVEFIGNNFNSQTFRIYRKEFILKKIEDFKFKNPVIIIKNKEDSISSLDNYLKWFGDKDDEQKLIIADKIITEYKTIYKTEENIGRKNKGETLSKNFKYYFKYPLPDEEFEIIGSGNRNSIYKYEDDNKKKIFGICGPIGIGKSMTLLLLVRIKPNYCYFNIKALHNASNQILIWRDQLLLHELIYALKKKNYQYEAFENFKNQLDKSTYFWQGIIIIINSFIKSKIKMNFIFVQYKEKFDHDYEHINEISKILEKDKENYVSIIVSSSINDKDVRTCLIGQWRGEKKAKAIFDYNYILNLIDSTDII